VQERLVEEDGEALRKRLGLNNITGIIPGEASTVTELVFQHVDRTGEWLLGDLYSRNIPERGYQFKVYVRTKNLPIKKVGSLRLAPACLAGVWKFPAGAISRARII